MVTETVLIEVSEKGAKVVSRNIDEIGKSSKESGKAVNQLSTLLKTLAASVAAYKLGQLIKESTALNLRYKELGTSLSVVGRNVGITRKEMDQTATTIQKMGISMIESRQTVLKLATSHIDLAKAEELADLARNAAIVGQINTSQALGKIVQALRSGELEILKTIGLNVSFEQGYKDLAAELGKTTNELTQAEKQTSRLNVVLGEAPELAGLYTAAMSNAGKQMRSTARLTEDLKVKLGEVFSSAAQTLVIAYTGVLKDLDSQLDDLTGSGDFERWGDNIARTIAILIDSARSLVSIFKIVGSTIGAVAAQAVALADLDFDAVGKIQDALVVDIREELDGLTKYQDLVESSIIQRKLLSESVTGISAALNENTDALEDNQNGLEGAAGATEKLKDEGAEFVAKLQAELDAIGKTNVELAKMEAATLGVSKQADTLIDAIEAQTIAQKNFDDEMERGADITSATTTRTEQYAIELDELDRLYAKNVISAQTYDRALVNLETAFEDLGKTSKSIFGDTEQFGIQAARNIQTSFADFLFKPFEKGLDDMLKSFIDILRRMAAEAVSAKILESVFSSFSATGAIGGSSFGQVFSGLTGGTAGTRFNNAGGAGTAFIGGPGTAIGGTGKAVGTAGFNASNVLGVAAAGLIGTGIGSAIAGDKRVFGANGTAVSGISAGVGAGIGAIFGGPGGAQLGAGVGGIIGGLTAKLFGRGPLKQKESTLELNISGDDIAGALITRFFAKGSAFKSSRTDNVISDIDSGELLNAFNGFRESGISGKLNEFALQAGETAQAIGVLVNNEMAAFDMVLRDTAELFGVSAAGLDNFSTTLKIIGEKGEALSETEINAVFEDLANQMTESIAPAIGELSKAGEGAFETVLRLGDQFVVLTRASQVLGLSLEDAEERIKSMGFAMQTEIIDAFGGIDEALQVTNFFAENFLNDAQKLRVVVDTVDRSLVDLGITVEGTTKRQFGEMLEGFLQMGAAGAENARIMFENGDAFLAAREEFVRLAVAEVDAAAGAEALSNGLLSLGFSEGAVAGAAGAAIGGLNGVAGSLVNVANAAKVALQAANTAAAQQITIQGLRDNVTAARERLASIQQRQLDTSEKARERQAKNDAQDASDQLRSDTKAAQRANSEQISGLQKSASIFQEAVSKFDSAARRISDFNDTLSLGDLSPLTPAERLNEARAFFNRTRSAAFGGDAEALEKLPQAATEFLRASQVANASNADFVSDFNFVKGILQDAESIAINERDIAADQLQGIESQIAELQRANQNLGDIASASQSFNSGLQDVGFGIDGVSSDLGVVDTSIADVEKATALVEDAVEKLTVAVLTGPGNPLISDADIRAVVFDNNRTVQEMVELAVEFGVSVQQVAAATGISISAINKSIQGLAITNQAIRDFVYTPGRTNQEIYDAATANGVSSNRLATVANIPLQDINKFVRDNNLQSFAIGTDRIMRDGIAMLHRDEAVVPSSVPAEIVALRADVAKMIESQDRNTERVVEATYISSQQNARIINESNQNVEKQKGFKRRAGGGLR